ncbi:MAG: hypothetical protein Q9225_001113 [Loekoesia sp. 1 TL-2023]
MERFESSNATHNDVEDDGENLQSPGGNEYPDPDSFSTHPWWEKLYLSRDSNNHDEHDTPQLVIRDPHTQSGTVQGYDTDLLDFNTTNTNQTEPRAIDERFLHPALAYKQDHDTDPAFELTSADTNDESSSGLSQAISDDHNSPFQPLRVKKHGRPRRRNGCIGGNGRHGEAIRRSQKGIKRGLRKPLEPSDEFKSLHTQATAAFIDADYATAEQLTLQAILLNPEMYAAHSLLSEIHTARGDYDKAVTALFNGAHTRPRDIEAWESLAQMLLARPDEDTSALIDALYCYSRIIQVDPQNVHARHRRAALNRRLGYMGRAATEYEHLLKMLPHDLTILRSLAEIYTETNNVHRATEHYGASVKYYQAQEPKLARTFTWSDVNIYVELFADQQRYIEGIAEIKSLSRWLLGRHGDTIWENFQKDDREWDIEDYPRRAQVEGFHIGSHANTSYGKGMPLELHVKLGTYRLKSDKQQIEEATRQFELLKPGDSSSDAQLFKYPDMFRDVADALRSAGFYREALNYYEPLHRVPDFVDISYYVDMAFCYKSVGLKPEADACYRSIVDLERGQSRTRICLSPNASEAAATRGTVIDGMDTSTPDRIFQPPEGVESEVSDLAGFSRTTAPSAMLIPRPPKQSSKRRDTDRKFQVQLHEEKIHTLYGRIQDLLSRARSGNVEALLQWMTTAQVLVDDIRSYRGFHPRHRNLKSYGYSNLSPMESLKDQVDQAMQDIVSQVGAPPHDFTNDPAAIAGDFRGIPLSAWLDLMLEYAMLLAHSQDFDKAYEILDVANHANIFYSSPDSMFLIHLCWFTCALIANDEETSCNVARWFMKEYQFTTDGYRLFCVLNRLCDGRNTWFNCGPTQKFVRRQLKAVDYSLLDQSQRHKLYQERASYTTKDNEGRPISAGDMDLALLMLYGYMLYLGKSFALSLNYFFRAFALDPRNPIINLSLALAYIQHAIKRQSANRHHLITQGLAFLFDYYELRRTSRTPSERQEAEFNVARAYHMLGLTHLAIPYYERCISLGNSPRGVKASQWNDFSAEAAFALRNIWAVNEETGKAADISRRYLVM